MNRLFSFISSNWRGEPLRDYETVVRLRDERRGQPPYDPSLMTKLLVYGFCVGVFSSRSIQKRLQEDVPFRVLAAGNEPNFRTISDFRKNHLEALQGLFEQVLAMALEAGAMKLGRVSLDGTKMKANASKHKAMSYGRMKEKQQQLKDAPRHTSELRASHIRQFHNGVRV